MTLAVQPEQPDALHLLGLVRRDQRRMGEALALLEHAVATAPEQSSFQFNLGATQRQAGQLAQAEATLRRAPSFLTPTSPEIRSELGLTLLDRRALVEAEAVLREAIALAPDHAATHFGLAGLLLLVVATRRLGQVRLARSACERLRLGSGGAAGTTRRSRADDPAGGRAGPRRHAPDGPLRAAPGRTRRASRAALPTGDPGAAGDVGRRRALRRPDEPLPRLISPASLLDLPGLLGTTVETISQHAVPAPGPAAGTKPGLPVLASNATSESYESGWPGRGDPDHRANGLHARRRWPRFEPLGSVLGIEFVALQKRHPGAEALAPPPGLCLTPNLGPDLADFADTAAVISLLDLVITVDTSVGHLAGAIGRPTWILPWATHDWRWLLDREDTPWYPTARLFRQEQPGAWTPTIERVAAALMTLASSRASSTTPRRVRRRSIDGQTGDALGDAQAGPHLAGESPSVSMEGSSHSMMTSYGPSTQVSFRTSGRLVT